MNPPRVREAEPGDIAGILALYAELRPQDPPITAARARETLAQFIARPDLRLLVCEVEGMLVCTCMLAVIPQLANGTRPFGVIEHVITLAAHRQRGYARQVLQHALSLAWSSRCCKVLLLSGAQRTTAHKLYESVGFSGDIERGFVAKPMPMNKADIP